MIQWLNRKYIELLETKYGENYFLENGHVLPFHCYKLNLKPINHLYCLRVIQDYHNANIFTRTSYNLKHPIAYDPYIKEMYLQDIRIKTRNMFLMGSSYKKHNISVLSKITDHGVDFASMLRKNILLKSGLS